MIKQLEISDPKSCLNKAEADEPLFVLRAQDALAGRVVREWVTQAKICGVPPEKIESAERIAKEMDAWPTRKIPD